MDKIASQIPVSGDGKELQIKGDRGADGLRFEVSGKGMNDVFNDSIMRHLENISERVRTIYGDAGRLILTADSPHGRKIILKVPEREFHTA